MRNIVGSLLVLLLPQIAFADNGVTRGGQLWGEKDNSPDFTVCQPMRINNTDLTQNADGSCEMTTGGTGDITDVGNCASGDCDGQTITWGDGSSGDVTHTYDGDAGTDGVIAYDVSEDQFEITGGLDLTTSNIIYLQITDNIETAIAAATAGDTIVLATGTYTITDDIDIEQAINIVGQGIGETTIACATASKNIFDVLSDNVRIANLSTSCTADQCVSVRINASAGTVFSSILLENIKLVQNAASTQLAMSITDAGGVMRNIECDVTSSNSSVSCVILGHTTTAEAATTWDMYNLRLTGTGSGNEANTVLRLIETDSASNVTFNMFNVISTATNSGIDRALQADGDKIIVVAHGSRFDGANSDVLQANSASLTLQDSVLVNGITSGTISTSGEVITAELGNTAGDLKIAPDVQGDVTLFSDTDVGDTTDGKRLKVQRKAAEGDNILDLYIDQFRDAHLILDSTSRLKLDAGGNIDIQQNAAGGVDLFRLAASGENPFFSQGGFITNGSAVQDILWRVNDGSDNFELTKEANIGSFDIQMPLITDDITMSGDLDQADTSPHHEFCDTTDGTAWQIRYDTAETFPGLAFWRGTNASCTDVFAIATAKPSIELTSSDEVLFGAGKVGIGTDTPDELLHVANGNVRFEDKVDIGIPGTGGGLDIGEGGSYSVNASGTTVVRAFSYDASAVSGSRFTELTITSNNTLLGDAGDRFYVGSPFKFWASRVEIGVAKTTELYAGNYWNGSALTSMTYMGVLKDSVTSLGDGIMEQIAEQEYISFDNQIDTDWAKVDNQLDAIPNTGTELFWVALQVPVGGFATAPRVDDIKVRGTDSDFATGISQLIFWGKARVERHDVLSAFARKSGGQPAVEDIQFTSSTTIPLLALRNSQSDGITFSFQLPQGIDTSAKMELTIDWFTDNSGSVDWTLQYYIMTQGTVIGSGQSDTASVDTTISPSAADALQTLDEVSNDHTIDISTLKSDDLIVFELIRKGSSDTNSGKVYVVDAVIHYTVWSLGEHV